MCLHDRLCGCLLSRPAQHRCFTLEGAKEVDASGPAETVLFSGEVMIHNPPADHTEGSDGDASTAASPSYMFFPIMGNAQERIGALQIRSKVGGCDRTWKCTGKGKGTGK